MGSAIVHIRAQPSDNQWQYFKHCPTGTWDPSQSVYKEDWIRDLVDPEFTERVMKIAANMGRSFEEVGRAMHAAITGFQSLEDPKEPERTVWPWSERHKAIDAAMERRR